MISSYNYLFIGFCQRLRFLGVIIINHGEGNGNPLQCSCLENPRDGEAWWAAIYGVAQSRTRLKRPSSSSIINHNSGYSNQVYLSFTLSLGV